MTMQKNDSYWHFVWSRFKKHNLGVAAFGVVLLFCFVGVYAPLLASSKPLVVKWNGEWYFPLLAYLFYPGFYTKRLDIFFNLLMFILPIALIVFSLFKGRWRRGLLGAVVLAQLSLFIYFGFLNGKDPAANPALNLARQQAIQRQLQDASIVPMPSWDFDLQFMTPYAKLNAILSYQQRKQQHQRLMQFEQAFRSSAEKTWVQREIQDKRAALLREGVPADQLPDDEQLKQMIMQETPVEIRTRETAMPTLWQMKQEHAYQEIARQRKIMESNAEEGRANSPAYLHAKAKIAYITEKREWLEKQAQSLQYEVMPLLRPFHWEDDAGGEQSLNRYISWWELTRINRKDMVAALIFGVRISLVVGITAVALAMVIGIPVGSLAGYYGGTFDIIVSRMLEIWESMPTFFMLLLVVAITQSKSIFLIITVIGIFGWTSFSRYIRGEFFKQRNLAYVEACRAAGFSDGYIIFSHILPNAIPPVLTLLPFAVMAAITSEAGLSFLGLGEEGSCSWGVLMDEGRTAFPGESYLLWPPAILLTILLVAIALVGDALRDALDPKSQLA